jgi:glycerol-3-phosphate dehydrogenase
MNTDNLANLRRHTRMGMGTCQSELCACRAANVLCKVAKLEVQKSEQDLTDFISERWKGMFPVAWGETLKEGQLMSQIYEGLCGLNQITPLKKEDQQ